MGTRFCRRSRFQAAGILCVFQGLNNAELGQKIRCGAASIFENMPNKKRERGDTSPRTVSRFTCSLPNAAFSSGGQNLAALSAATGQNLAAVGGSHSLAEAMNLGTVALSGLIGTLHLLHLLFLNFLPQPKMDAAIDYIDSHTTVL